MRRLFYSNSNKIAVKKLLTAVITGFICNNKIYRHTQSEKLTTWTRSRFTTTGECRDPSGSTTTGQWRSWKSWSPCSRGWRPRDIWLCVTRVSRSCSSCGSGWTTSTLPSSWDQRSCDRWRVNQSRFVCHYFLLIFISTCPTFQRFSFMNVFVSESQTPPPVRIQNNSIKDHGSWVPYAHLTAM